MTCCSGSILFPVLYITLSSLPIYSYPLHPPSPRTGGRTDRGRKPNNPHLQQKEAQVRIWNLLTPPSFHCYVVAHCSVSRSLSCRIHHSLLPSHPFIPTHPLTCPPIAARTLPAAAGTRSPPRARPSCVRKAWTRDRVHAVLIDNAADA
jgi:hypothetical protein